MKALQQIIRRVAGNPSHPWALATLVQTEGSTYRKPGARLLVDSDGGTLGVLSGGCLEEEIARHGQIVIGDTSPVLLSFDTKRLYGCDGQLKILVEPLPAAGQNGNLITKIGRLLRNREVCRIRTCFEGEALGSELLASDVLLAERRGVFIDEGILEMALYFRIRRVRHAGWVLFDGIVTLILGIFIWAQWPSSSVWVIGTLVGISLIFSGISRFMLSLAVRDISPASV